MKPDEESIVFIDRWKESYYLSELTLPEPQVVQMIISNSIPGISALLKIAECTTLAQLYHKGPSMQHILKDGSLNNALGLTKSQRGQNASTNADLLHEQVSVVRPATGLGANTSSAPNKSPYSQVSPASSKERKKRFTGRRPDYPALQETLSTVFRVLQATSEIVHLLNKPKVTQYTDMTKYCLYNLVHGHIIDVCFSRYDS